MNAAIKPLTIAILAFMLGAVFIAKQNRDTAHRESDCARSIECLDQRAKSESERKKVPVASKTGNFYFRGIACGDDCTRLVKGYRFAEKAGLTRMEGCDNPDPQLRIGCLAYYKELLDSRYDTGEDADPRH